MLKPLKKIELKPVEKIVLKPMHSSYKFKQKVIPRKEKLPSKHYPAAIKEWKNSVYAYNKKTIRSISVKDNMTNDLIKCYFYLSNNKKLARSRRMRALIRKKTQRKIFVSKPEIKQTNDKAIVTVYTYNREKQNLLRKIFYDQRRKGLLDYKRNFNAISIEPKHINKNILNKTKITKTSVTRSFKLLQNRTIKSLLRLNSLKKGKRYYLKLYLRFNRRMGSRLTLLKKRNRNFNYFYLNKLKLNLFKRKRGNLFLKFKRRRGKRAFPAGGIKLKNQLRLFNAKLSLNKYEPFKVKKRKGKIIKTKLPENVSKLLRIRFYCRFIKYIFSKFKIKVFVNKKEVDNIIAKYNKRKIPKRRYLNRKARKKRRLYKLAEKIMPLAKLKQWNNRIYFIIKGKIKYMTIKDLVKYTPYKKLPSQKKYIISSIKNIKLTIYLKHVLGKIYKIKSLDIEQKLLVMFNKYHKKNFLKYLALKSRKESLVTSNFVKLLLNRYKFNKLLPGLKTTIANIYNKKTELNIVDLKYPHLNTDIYTQSIALKLRKKANLLKILRRSLQLAKIQRNFINYIGREELLAQYDLNNIEYLNKYRSIKLSNLEKEFNVNNPRKKDYLDKVLGKIYPRSFSWLKESVNMSNTNKQIIAKTNVNPHRLEKKKKYIKKAKRKLNNILARVKYKWVTGAKLEAAGRLTKRYTASRSLFKYKYKGSLQNKDFSKKIEYVNKSMPTVRLRHQVKANSQYSSASSMRRIGAYGIKGWISGF